MLSSFEPVLEQAAGTQTTAFWPPTLLKAGSVSDAISRFKASAISTLYSFLNNRSLDTIANKAASSLKLHKLVWRGKNKSYTSVHDWLNDRLGWTKGEQSPKKPIL